MEALAFRELGLLFNSDDSSQAESKLCNSTDGSLSNAGRWMSLAVRYQLERR
jgi:hypothetical protein